jgi:probable rRNA maturation factor
MSDVSEALSVEVAVRCKAWLDECPDAAVIAARAAEVALAETVPAGHFIVDISLSDDAEQRRLNRTYRGKDRSTNVLAFPQSAPEAAHPGPPLLLGDVVLAFETVQREAAEQGKPFADHVCHLVIHGVLHLLGFDHDTAGGAAVMESREVKILAGLGVPDPYRGTM